MKYFATTDENGWVSSISYKEGGVPITSTGPNETEVMYLPSMERPHPYYQLRLVNGDLLWVDERTLEQAKSIKRNLINSWRTAATKAGFQFNGVWVDTDELSRSDIDGTNGTVTLTGAFPGGWPGYWKARDNSLIPINSLDTWKDFYGAMSAQGTTNFGISQLLKAQLDSAITVEEVDAISWPT